MYFAGALFHSLVLAKIGTQPQRGAAAPASMTPEGAIDRELHRSLSPLTSDNATVRNWLDLAELAKALARITSLVSHETLHHCGRNG